MTFFNEYILLRSLVYPDFVHLRIWVTRTSVFKVIINNLSKPYRAFLAPLSES